MKRTLTLEVGPFMSFTGKANVVIVGTRPTMHASVEVQNEKDSQQQNGLRPRTACCSVAFWSSDRSFRYQPASSSVPCKFNTRRYASLWLDVTVALFLKLHDVDHSGLHNAGLRNDRD